MEPFSPPAIPAELEHAVRSSFRMNPLCEESLRIQDGAELTGKRNCRVISVIKGELLTDEAIETIDFEVNDGIDVARDILKLAVVERHHQTGHIGLGFVRGIGMKRGAMAASVSHDAHNLIIIGSNDADMVVAGNRVRELGGGFVVVENGEILSEMPLPIAGLMGDGTAQQMEKQNTDVREAVYQLGIPRTCNPFLTMAFVSLPVIPHLKMTTHGLVHVETQTLLPLWVEKDKQTPREE